MITGFYWVVEDEIAGMAMPTAGRAHLYLEDADRAAAEEFRREIEDLKSRGIRAVVSLTEEPLSASAIRNAGLDYLHIPIPDMTAPTPGQIEQFTRFVRERAARNEATVAHCYSGSGRTGTMIACYLVSQGMSSSEAIRAVRNKRPGAIETFRQEEAVIDYAIAVSSGAGGE